MCFFLVPLFCLQEVGSPQLHVLYMTILEESLTQDTKNLRKVVKLTGYKYYSENNPNLFYFSIPSDRHVRQTDTKTDQNI